MREVILVTICILTSAKPEYDSETDTWKTDFHSVDLSNRNAPHFISGDFPIIDLIDAEHFDYLLYNHKSETRRGSVILFRNDNECEGPSFSFRRDQFPETEILMAEYPLRGYKRTWYKDIPERDLSKRFHVNECNTIVYISRECNGIIDYCTKRVSEDIDQVGCDDFTSCQQYEKYQAIAENPEWMDWVKEMHEKYGGPEKPLTAKEYRQLDVLSQNILIDNVYSPPVIPKFSRFGYKFMKIPSALLKEIRDWYDSHLDIREPEGDLQAFLYNGSFIVHLDHDMEFRNRIAEHYIKPIVEEWVGMPLEYTSCYGIREYPTSASMKTHTDTMNTHVISVTMNIGIESTDWPLEVINHNGDTFRYKHGPGTMVLYESLTVIHGRPYPLPKGPHLGVFAHFMPIPWNAAKYKAQVASMHGPKRLTTTVRNHQTDTIWISRGAEKKVIHPKSDLTFKGTYEDVWEVYTPPHEKLGEFHTTHDNEIFEIGSQHHRAQENPDRIPLSIHNHRDETVDVHWVSGTGQLNKQGEVLPSAETTIHTFPGHKFVIQCGKQIVDEITMRNNGVVSKIYPHKIVRDEL